MITIKKIAYCFSLSTALSMTLAPACAEESGRSFRDCDVCPDMMVVPAGEFTMGSDKAESGHLDEKPQRAVRIAKAFAVAKTETTFAQWDACTADGKCMKADDAGFGRNAYPAINISWNDAQDYAAWLSAKTGKSYRLLSEAEFEYAARGGTRTPWYWGGNDDRNKACGFANLHDESGKKAHPNYVWSHVLCDDSAEENAPTGKYKPNAFGLHDMIGNVREWVADCHQTGYTGAPDDGSVRPHSGACEKRVVRGGGWVDGASTARAAYRYAEAEGMRNYQLGFRVARDLP